MAVIGHLVEAEVIPCIRWEQRVDLHNVIYAWPQANQSGDDQIVVGRMIVVRAAFSAPFNHIPSPIFPGLEPGTGNLVARIRVQVFVDPRYNVSVLLF